MHTLRFVSCMPESAAILYRAIVRHLNRGGLSSELIEVGSLQDRDRMFDRGDADVALLGSVSYVRKIDRAPASLDLIVAPVMKGARYKQRPIAFCDVVVRRESNLSTFADLRSLRLAQCERDAQPGASMFRHHIEQMGLDGTYFQRVVDCGSHADALQRVARGGADATAMDSVTLELECRLRPELAAELRVMQTFGPNPSAPWVARAEVPADVRSALRRALLDINLDESGRVILAEGLVNRFVEVRDADYDSLRRTTRRTERPASQASPAAN